MIIKAIAAVALTDYLILFVMNIVRCRSYRREAWMYAVLALTQLPLGFRQPVLWAWMVIFALMGFGSWLQARQGVTLCDV